MKERPHGKRLRSGIVVHVFTAGAGRMGFGAAIEDGHEVDRQDGDVDGFCDTPGLALAALGKRLDADLAAEGFRNHVTALDDADEAKRKKTRKKP